MTHFEQLEKAIISWKKEQEETARKTWKSLPREFQIAVLSFVRDLHTDLVGYEKKCPTVKMCCPEHGDFVLSKSWLEDLKTYVPKIIL